MKDNLIDYPGDGEHSHAQRVPFIVWALLACVLVLAFTIIGLSTYLIERTSLADTRVERQRQAICAVLGTIRGHVPAEITQARQTFARPEHPRDCYPLPPPPHHRTPTVAVRVTPAPRPTSGEAPASAGAAPTPAPTVTRTIRPTPSSTPTRRPSPTPSPTRTCTVHVGPVCV